MFNRLLQLIISFFILRFTFGELYCKNKKIKVGKYIGTSLCKYQDHQDYWPIIHEKLENLFTTITNSFQDFSHKDICAYITSQARKCSTPLVWRYLAKLTCDTHKTSDQTFWRFFNFYGFWIFEHTQKQNKKNKINNNK